MSTSYEASPSVIPNTIILAGDRTDEHFQLGERVVTFFYRTWMAEPRLLDSRIKDISPGRGAESPGFVSVSTKRTPDIPSGGIVGISVDSAALIQLSVLPHLRDETFRKEWVASGSVESAGEQDLLNDALAHQLAGTLRSLVPQLDHTPGRARRHIPPQPGFHNLGRVSTQVSLDHIELNH